MNKKRMSLKILSPCIFVLVLSLITSSTLQSAVAAEWTTQDNSLGGLHYNGPGHVTRGEKNSITVNATSENGETLHVFAKVMSNNNTLKIGFTPITFVGKIGQSYKIHLSDQKDAVFHNWKDNDSHDNPRTFTLTQDANFTAIYNMGERITLQDLGVLQLVSHDLYNVNRTLGVDIENANMEDDKLNLSTVLNFSQQDIANGGEPRNSENIIIHTVAVDLGKKYLEFISHGKTHDESRHLTMQIFMKEIKEAYIDTFHQAFPKPNVTAGESFPNDLDGDLALRTEHAFLPSQIMVDGKLVPILDLSLQGKTLDHHDLMQLSKPMDGTFDPAFRNITIFIPPNNLSTIDLFERDSSFAHQFNTDFTFEHFMDELRDGKYNKNDDVMKVIRAEFASAQVGIP